MRSANGLTWVNRPLASIATMAVCAADSSEPWNISRLLQRASHVLGVRQQLGEFGLVAQHIGAHGEEAVHHLAQLTARAPARQRFEISLAHALRKIGQRFDAAINVAHEITADQRHDAERQQAERDAPGAHAVDARGVVAHHRLGFDHFQIGEEFQARGDGIDGGIHLAVGEAAERHDVLRVEDGGELLRGAVGVDAGLRDLREQVLLLGRARHALQFGPMRADAGLRVLDDAAALLPAHQVIAHLEGGVDDFHRIRIRHRLDAAQPGQRFFIEFFERAPRAVFAPFVECQHAGAGEQQQPEERDQLQPDAEFQIQAAHRASSGLRPAPARDHFGQLIARHRPADQIALRAGAAEFGQHLPLLHRFHALGNDAEIQFAREF